LNRAIAANGIKPAIDKVFGFDEVARWSSSPASF
jgi:hypothetical protein